MATESQVISEDHPIDSKGGLPTMDEFSRLENSIMDLMEFGLEHLLERIVDEDVSAHENRQRLPVTFDYVGRYSHHVRAICELSDDLAEQANRLKAYRPHLEQIALADGHVFDEPPFENANGKKYKSARLVNAT